ncbi:response regulator, partial [Actinomadura sp. KC216]
GRHTPREPNFGRHITSQPTQRPTARYGQLPRTRTEPNTSRHIKSRPRTRDIPIIFLTAGGEAGEQAFRGYAAGAVDYLTKPFDPWLLRAKVSVFVELHRRNLQLRRQAQMLRQTLAEGDGEAVLAGGERLLSALDERVKLIEEDVARLQAGEPAADLDAHVADLRLALDALSPGG